MNPSDQIPKKLPMWAFYATDVVLLGTAWLIAQRSAHPLSTQAAFLIVACVIAGAIVGLVPLIVHYERQKNETLDERQRALEGLARTVSASAEQISIAAGGLHAMAELAQKNLRHAEQLPHKLQDKIAEFQSQLASANDTEKEELEKELVALRTTESERLETISDRISKSTAEWTKLETATRQHLAGASEALGKLALGTASAIGTAQSAAEQALLQARTEAARVVGEAVGSSTRAIEAARTSALADLDAKVTAASAGLADRLVRDLTAQLAPHLAAVQSRSASDPASAHDSGPSGPGRSGPPPSSADSENGAALRTTAPSGPEEAVSHAESTPVPPKRPRKPRREEPAGLTPSAPTEPAPAPASSNADAPAHSELPPVSFDRIPEVAPIAPDTANPFSSAHIPGGSASSATATAAAPALATGPAKPSRKRAPSQPAPEPEPALDLVADESHAQNGGTAEGVLSSDGATRLQVTAYIGIGNRLFIRGEGPGLSWEKGVPLQFISIGKWRWETNDAAGPVRFKLFKNDEAECVALGAQSLDPGHQQELTAAF